MYLMPTCNENACGGIYSPVKVKDYERTVY